MKKILAALLCILLLCNFISCNAPAPEEKTPSTTEPTSEKSSTPTQKYSFISQEQKAAWKTDLLSTLANIGIKDSEHYIPGSYAIGLMDINFDNIPEVLAASAGGSMGNVCIDIYDLSTGKKICDYNAPHWQDGDNIYLCVAYKDGENVILSEGSFRVPDLGWVKLFGTLSRQMNFDQYLEGEILFAESVAKEIGHYECNGQTVTKEEYDARFEQFLEDYQPINETQIQLIKWEEFDAENREELNKKMADALIGSAQQFVYTCTANEK